MAGRYQDELHIPDEQLDGVALCGKTVTFEKIPTNRIADALKAISYGDQDRYCPRCLATLEEIVERESE